MPMVALQSALAVDMDARKDGNLARRQEAARLYESAIEALEEALQRKQPRANVFLSALSRPRQPGAFSLTRQARCCWRVHSRRV
jgi:hypothetical protein